MVALLAVMAMAADKPSTPASRWPVHGLIENEDCTNFFYFRKITRDVDGGAMVDGYVDNLAEAGVRVLMCNTNARRTNYHSSVWDTFWDGWDPDGPDDQPFLKPMAPADIPAWRQMVGSMRVLHEQGVDYPARVVARCRKRSISPWISLRMNDVHYNDVLDHPFHGRFWVQHPEFLRKGASGYFANALDYAHPEVRDVYRRLIEETLERYDVDGLELDFMREPHVFSPGKEREGAPVLTQWLRDVRRLARTTAARRKHPVRIGVRVPSHPETAEGFGLDALTWAREGLVDLVVPTPRWATLEFDMPIAEWRRLLKPYPKVMLAGGLEILCRSHPGAEAAEVRPEQAYAAAASAWQGGADAVYLFNYFQDSMAPDTYRQMLRTMASPKALASAPRTYTVTYRDITTPGEEYHPPLPAEGTSLRFELPVRPGPKPRWQAQVALGIDGAQAPSVQVNGQPCGLESHGVRKDGPSEALYTVPIGAFAGRGRAEVTVTAGAPVRVVSLEIRVAPEAGHVSGAGERE